MNEKILRKTSDRLLKTFRQKPDMAVILGSGLASLSDSLSNRKEIPYSQIGIFPKMSVHGHKNILYSGTMGNKNVIMFSGRFHYYQGLSIDQTTLPVRLAACLGVKHLIVTNAAGGINPKFRVGDIMIIRDHINLTGSNPLIGYKGNLPVFIDMTNAYSPIFRKKILHISKKFNIPVREGVYACMSGPSYETPAEIHMLQSIGADAVGMSTVPEVIVARQENLDVTGISIIANLAAGLSGKKLTHEDVLMNVEKAVEKTVKIIREFIISIY